MPVAPPSIFAANLEVGTLTSEPVTEDADGAGHLVYRANCAIGPWSVKTPIVVTFLPLVAGLALPYALGDVVHVLHNHGGGVVVGHYTSAVVHEGNTQLSPRGAKDVRIGPTSGGAWEALALHDLMSREVLLLQALVVAVAGSVPAGAGTAALNAAKAAAFVNPLIGIDTAVGGDAAAQAMGRKAN